METEYFNSNSVIDLLKEVESWKKKHPNILIEREMFKFINEYDLCKLPNPVITANYSITIHYEENDKPKVIICDLCGEPIVGESHPVYDENFHVQKGLKQCSKCLVSSNLDEDDNRILDPIDEW